MRKPDPVVESVLQKLDVIAQQMTVGLARKIADSYVEHVVGAIEVTPEHNFKNNGEAFLREFFGYSPVQFSEEEKLS